MRTIGRGLYANVIPNQLVLDPYCFIREENKLTDEASEQVDFVLGEFKWYLDRYTK